ncbi:carbohydrate ABC transporter permease [Luteimicrobium subarcticum]|uniref:N,N'-diacetylchitobiose transport system permease protein n=1 Tax=Luteimicrobium subarcticum TaxID=620910 RepID=A0A2M8WS16_9MICO|nr:carbohydrate ABC transporter permease [Luteimicrobium subarcticum]PJI93719.1 N,N'-diacetylchitobiose transport system permease protein [Luteimicrobium subarcticum]
MTTDTVPTFVAGPAGPGAATTAGRRRRRLRPGRVALGAAAVVTILASVFPVYWMVRTALEPTRDLQAGSVTPWPRALTLDHFRTALAADGFWAFWRNSLFVTLGSVLVALVVAALAAFAVARLRWRGRGVFVLVVFAAQMAPWEALLIPMYIVVRDVGMLDRLVTLLVIYTVVTLPFTILTIRGFLDAIPVELEEAARVDGCSRATAFRRIVFPLLAPGLLSTSLFGFITAWNEFAFANTLLIKNQDSRTLPVWLSSFNNVFGTDWGATMAASTLFMLPVLLVFVVLQNRVTGGLTAGAVKG